MMGTPTPSSFGLTFSRAWFSMRATSGVFMWHMFVVFTPKRLQPNPNRFRFCCPQRLEGFQGSNSPWKISMHRPMDPPNLLGSCLGWRFLDPRKTKAVTTNPTPFKKGPLSGPGCIYPGHFQPKHRLLQLSHTFLTVLGDALLQLGWWTLGFSVITYQPALTLSRWVPGVPLLVGNGVFLLSFWGGYFGSSP